jgi:hypothetical protein
MTNTSARTQKGAGAGQKRRRLLSEDEDVANQPVESAKRWNAVFEDTEQDESPAQELNSQKESVPLHQESAKAEHEAALLRFANGNKEAAKELDRLLQKQVGERYLSAVALDNAAAMLTAKRRDPATFTPEYIDRKRRVVITDELMTEILRRLSEGVSIYRTCRDDDSMPSYAAAVSKLNEPEWKAKYDAARSNRTDKMGDEIAEATRELKELVAAGAPSEMVNAVKLHVNTLQWLMARMNPQGWGDKQTVDLNANVKVKSESDVDARLLAFFGKAGVNLNANTSGSSGEGE